MHLHQYADDSQVYVSGAVSNTAAVIDKFTACINDISAWMCASRLQLSPTKTEVMWLVCGQFAIQVGICDLSVLSTQIKPVESARDLGIVIDSQLSLLDQVAALCHSGYYMYHLRQLHPSLQLWTPDAAKTSPGVYYKLL